MRKTSMTVTVDRRNPAPRHSHAWRWGRATELYEQGACPQPQDDWIIHMVWAYVCEIEKAQSQRQIAIVRRLWPHLVAAHRVYRDADTPREHIESLLLAGEDPAFIAGETGLSEELLQTYAAVFFDLAAVVDPIWQAFHVEVEA